MRGDTSDKLIVKLASVLSTGYSILGTKAIQSYGLKGDFFVKGKLPAKS
jgi:hypothetical protein